MSGKKEELHSAITAKAELDRTVSRLIIEDVTSVMAKNLSTILDAMERQHVELLEATRESATRLGRLEARVDLCEADRAEMRARIRALEAARDG